MSVSLRLWRQNRTLHLVLLHVPSAAASYSNVSVLILTNFYPTVFPSAWDFATQKLVFRVPATCCRQIVVLHIDNNPLSGTRLSFSPCIIVIPFLCMSGMRLKFSHFRVLLFKGSFDFFFFSTSDRVKVAVVWLLDAHLRDLKMFENVLKHQNSKTLKDFLCCLSSAHP